MHSNVTIAAWARRLRDCVYLLQQVESNAAERLAAQSLNAHTLVTDLQSRFNHVRHVELHKLTHVKSSLWLVAFRW